jgi:DNA-binding Lrp family transcriptional regulator
MRRSADLDDLDTQLITAMQIAPRAPWYQIGKVLNVAASTAARRWERLSEAGLAWLTCYPLRLPGVSAILAVIEVDCAAGRLHTVAADIVEDPHVFNVSQVTGSRDLVITVAFADPAALARYVGFRMSHMDGVRDTRTHIATDLHTDGSRWRLDRLPDESWARLRTRGPAVVSTARATPDTADVALMMALTADPREPAVDLARRTELSVTSVRRRLARLVADKMMVYRCEVARCVSGWRIAVNFWCTVPAERVAHVTTQLIGIRETRWCASLSGPYNLMFGAWLRSVDDVQPFEKLIGTRIPGLVIADRSVTLWEIKLGGHILDPEGRHLRCVPMAPWSEKATVVAEAALVDQLRRP